MKKYLRSLILLAAVLLALFLTQRAQAQFNYTYTGPNTGNPGGINTEIDDNLGGWTTALNLNFAGGNLWSAPIPIAFNFRFYNNPVTAFRVSANGVLTFDVNTTVPPPGNNLAMPTGTLPDSSIACLWDQFSTNLPMGIDDAVHYKIFGSPGYRQLWIRWTSCERFNNTSAQGVTNAIVLCEGTNQIFVMDMVGTGGLSATVGIQLNSFTGFTVSPVLAGINGNNANGNNQRYAFTPNMVGNYTIGGTNPDFTTLNQASRALSTCGVGGPVNMLFRAGTYTNKDTIEIINGTSAINTVTFRSESGNKSLVNIFVPSDVGAGTNHAVAINNADFVTFRDLTISRSGTNAYGTAVELFGHATNIRFANCNILGSGITGTNTDRVGVFTQSGLLSNITIDSCVISNAATGVLINPTGTASGVSLKENTITAGSTGWAVMLANSPIAVLRGNVLTNAATVPALLVNNCDGAIEVTRNNVQSSGGVGASFLSCDGLDGRVYNNIFRSTANTPAAAALLITTCTNMQYDHNTCYTTNTNTAGAALTIDAASAGGASVILRNNILANFGTGYAVEELNNGDSYISMMRNNLYLSNGASFYIWNGNVGNTGLGLESVTAFAEIGNIYDVDPQFVNAGANDFKLQVTSPPRNSGMVLSLVPTDFDGLPRPINVLDPAPDMGAYEYICTPPLAAGSYTVGPTGTYTSMTAARNALLCGISGPVRFQVQAGSYSITDLVLPHVVGTSATDTIIFESLSGSQDVTFTRVVGSGTQIFDINGMDYVTFRNLQFATTGGSAARKVTIQDNSQNVQFFNCRFQSDDVSNVAAATGAHIFMHATGTDNLRVENCQFMQGSHALFVNGSSNVQVRYNDIQVAVNGVELQSTANPIVSYNSITRVGINTYRGIMLTTLTGSLTVSHNTLVATGAGQQNGIRISGYTGTNGLILNNMMSAEVNAANDGVLYLTNVSNMMVAYNSLRNTSTTAGSNAMHVTGSGTASSNNFYYNILQSATTPALEVTGAMTTSIGIMDQNIYFTDGGVLGRWNGSNRTTLALWQSFSGKDPNSIRADPLFASATDLHIGGASPAIAQISTPVVDVLDIDGAVRSLPTDIGADHFNCPVGLSGTYTIGATGDYTSFTDAAYDLWRCGTDGNVVFEIEPGTYNEQFVLRQYPRTNATDSVIFQGFGTANIVHPSSPSSADNYIVKLEDAPYITFDGISFDRPGGDPYATCVQLAGNTERFNIMDCNLANGTITNSVGQEGALIQSSFCTADTLRILNNVFNGGTEGIVLYGSYTLSGLHMEGNELSNYTNDGVYLAGAAGGVIRNNLFNPMGEAQHGVHLYQSQGSVDVDRNTIKVNILSGSGTFYGIWLDTQHSTNANPSLVTNNVVIINGSSLYNVYGIGCQFSDHIRVQHNSVSITATASALSAAFYAGHNNTNLTVQNNAWGMFSSYYAAHFEPTSSVATTCTTTTCYTPPGRLLAAGTAVTSLALPTGKAPPDATPMA